MRALTIKVPKGKGHEVKQIAAQHHGKNLTLQPTEAGEQVTVHLNNEAVSRFIEAISHLESAEITLVPRGVITMYPPAEQTPEQVVDVTYRSPIEIFLGGLQSVGSWTGLLVYSIAGAVLVWIGLYTGTSYLLVAAMLIAPFAGPAMNAALASAAGKMQLLQQSLLRYFVAIGTGIAVSFLLSLLVGQQHATPMMVSVSQISQVTLLLPLIAGVAGGANLIQSERDSLVSGAAVGMLVAASLAPPTGLIGMALNFGNWQLIRSGIFLLILQLAGIQLSAALMFRLMGHVTTRGVRFADGKSYVFPLSMSVAVLVIAGFMFWQFSQQPNLQKASLDTQITEVMRTELSKLDQLETIEVNARFTRGTLPDLNPVICELYLYRRDALLTDAQLKQQIEQRLYEAIKAQGWNADPMFNITLLDYPGEAPR
ncbi:uncharacterized hydrophobic domain-containing protein [Catalinimonas alkaloidigena]|uniref:Uncharacterized hydrophobic domain-containing protein n=1 Tax=Catalinimonas alkaloidigena TaxID=1075417 RepID=A0A1G9DGP1_9BACT|nr:DUF389 domain-containing protein [Catalinimonas alkaloidigena]SDK63041.1 uncharacterized hydrophobic domain-containing protein [Catalinimonas alkaloidigena]